MIKSVFIKNFKCIQELTLDLTYDQRKAPNGYAEAEKHPFIKHGGHRLMPVMALYGPNASGKTSVLEAIHALSLLSKGNADFRSVFYRPNVLQRPMDPTTRMEITWTTSDACFRYAAEASEEDIVEESLYLGDVPLFRIQNGVISIEKVEGREAVKDGIHLQCFTAGTNKQVQTAFSSIVQSFPGYDERINDAFNSLKVNYLDRTILPFVGLKLLASTFTEKESTEREQAALQLISKYLGRLDIRIKRIEVEKTKSDFASLPLQLQNFLQAVQQQPAPSAYALYDFKSIHRAVDGSEVAIKLTEESRGTQRLVGLLAFLLASIRTGNVALIDELDESLHPALLPQLIKFFSLREFNTKEAQLIFTIHNTELLAGEDLSVSEIAFISQSGFSGTKIRRLSSFPHARNVNNFRRRYLMGYYDAIPSAFI